MRPETISKNEQNDDKNRHREHLGTVYKTIEQGAKVNSEPELQEKSNIVEPLARWIACEQNMYIKEHCSRIVMTDQDKLYRCLSKHLKNLSTKGNWRTPLGILVTLIVAITTSSFKSVLGINSDTWLAVSVIAGLTVLFWFMRSFCRDLRSRDVEDVIEDIIDDIAWSRIDFKKRKMKK